MDQSGPDTVQRVAHETILALRAMSKNVDISTGKIEQSVIDAIRRSGIVAKVDRHEAFITDFSKVWNMGISGITSYLERVSGKK